jgi:nucleoside-diphosphate-sugar epimerase
MAKYLVTGGAGFIGSHIVRRLVSQGDQVAVIDNFLTGSRDNLDAVIDSVDLIEGDIRDAELLRDVMKDVEYCLHQAALPSVPRSVEAPVTSNEINVDGTLNVFLAAKEAGVKRVVYASSSSVYGNSPTLPKHEEMPPQPLSPYAITKLAGELYAATFHEIYGVPIVSLRYFNVFGPGQRPDSPYAAVIPIFLSLMAKGKPATVHGDGEQTRDFCYVDNVVSANLLACSAPAEKVSGKAFNVACEERHTINELVAGLNELLGVQIEPVHTPPRKGDVRDSLADISCAKRHFGYDPAIKFSEGLGLTVKWFQEGAI